jgi:thioesterase domain-containing protein
MYVPQSYQGRIDYFVSSDSISHTTSANGLEDSAETSVKRDYLSPWREFASGGIEIHRVPGGHREMVEEPHVQVLAASLKHCIARACNQSS